EFAQQFVARHRLQRRYVKEGGVIEPDRFPRLRVSRNRRADLARPQAIALFPLDVNRVITAVLLDLRLVLGLENRLPPQPEPVIEVSDVHPFFLAKALPRRWR